ncbi:GNAT family N-acetyltransferase [Leucobacter chromiireducens]|uniref:GNAT family N-acetyltransferase n=1 Tax=Leucobacter chromiireducens TaxID=283877 RepID=UPI003F7FF508
MLNSRFLPVEAGTTRLRPLDASDAATYAEGTADPTVRQFAHLPEPEYTSASVRAMIAATVMPALIRGDLAVLTIADATSDAFAGSLVLFDVSAESAEVGFWLHPRHRGQGHAQRALTAARQFATASGLHTLTAQTARDNAASQRTLENAGFVRAATTTGRTPAGAEIELVQYGLELCPDERPEADAFREQHPTATLKA